MIKRIHLLFLLISVTTIFAQKRVAIKGEVLFDTIALSNVHVFNKVTSKGTVTDSKGLFNIKVSVSDYLIISSLPYEVVQVEIDSLMIDKKFISIKLKGKINTLDEVIVKSHNLSGSLFLDRNSVPDTFEKEDVVEIKISESDLYAVGDYEEVNDRKLKNPTGDLMDATPIDIVSILYRLSSGLRKRIKSKKAVKKFNKQIPSLIISDMGDDFFTEELKIPVEKIDDFMEFCNNEALILLYKNNKKIELIESLIIKSKIYKKGIVNKTIKKP